MVGYNNGDVGSSGAACAQMLANPWFYNTWIYKKYVVACCNAQYWVRIFPQVCRIQPQSNLAMSMIPLFGMGFAVYGALTIAMALTTIFGVVKRRNKTVRIPNAFF